MTQDEALAILESGANVLLTGAAGTGKTYVLNKFIRRAKWAGKSVAVTATTGLAATHLNGTTIHSWSGIGVDDYLDKYAAAKLGKGRRELIKKAEILVIDEISMLHDYRLDMVDEQLRAVRESAEPFGGVQVVLCGDFFQLPPVNRRDGRQGGFVIGSSAWQQGGFIVCYLERQYRQAEDQDYTDILNGIRKGFLTRSQLAALRSRAGAADDPFAARTRLLTVNVDVDSVNNEHLDELDGEAYEYEMETHGGKNYVETLKRSCLAPELLRLKKGAAVMCVRNAVDRKYVNGSLGVVVGFDEESDLPIVELTNGRTLTIKPEAWELMDGDKRRAQITQLPLRLAWAITVHKSQGMTLDAARIDLSKAFVEGMGYVALSRVRSLKHLILDGLNGMALRVSPLAKEIDAELRARSEQALQDHAGRIRQWREDEASGAHEKQMEEQAEAAAAVIELPPPDPEIFEKLRAWRLKLAREQGASPFIIAHNKHLEAVAGLKPKTLEELLNVPGFGPKKVETYGKDIIGIIEKTV